MVMLQHKLNVKLSQRQILTPGLVQMVSVLALNKLELKDMINEEMVENPVLEELEDAVPLIDDVGRREEERERLSAAEEAPPPADKKDPFEEIDFGSFFKDYLDPGFRSQGDFEEIERPSFENFLSRPSTLTDHLVWQLGSIPTTPPERDAAKSESVVKEAVALGLGPSIADVPVAENSLEATDTWAGVSDLSLPSSSESSAAVAAQLAPVDVAPLPVSTNGSKPAFSVSFSREQLHEAIEIVRQLDPPGVACRDLRECLLYQLRYHQAQLGKHGNGTAQVLADAVAIVDQHLRALQNKQHKEISRAIARPVEAVQVALDYIRTLDPRPGQQYNKVLPRLIEPDVAFVKHGDEWLVMMNDDDVPTLRLNPAYRKLLSRDGNDRDTRNYVKERFKSAIQLIKNIEQRKQTILKVCYSIVTRQRDFLEKGIDELKPMMIKEVAEEIGVHPSTVSRAVANKYAHTPQGVFELRYFFSESVNGPEGGGTSLLILKRRVKKLIEEEDPTRPLTDEQITRILQSQGIQVTRRTVAKYREDMKIPSTHQRRVKK